MLPFITVLPVEAASYTVDFSSAGWTNPVSPMVASSLSNFDSSAYLSYW